jgi:hypothetical protein
VKVDIDGKQVAKVQIGAGRSLTLERPTGTNRSFVFVEETSSRATAAGVRPGRSMNGALRVRFYPEKERFHPNDADFRLFSGGLESSLIRHEAAAPSSSMRKATSFSGAPSGAVMPSMALTAAAGPSSSQSATAASRRHALSSGATILGSKTNQTFRDVSAIPQWLIDWPNVTEFNARLVVESPESWCSEHETEELEEVAISALSSRDLVHQHGHPWHHPHYSYRYSTMPPRIDNSYRFY